MEGALGELSPFHRANSFYAEGVHLDTVILPDGWRQRLLTWNLQSSYPAKPLFLDPHDLAVAKLVAHRGKDIDFVGALFGARLLDANTLKDRARMLPESVPAPVVETVIAWVDSVSATKAGVLPADGSPPGL